MPVHGSLHLQQRRQAWIERKKLPKVEDCVGKCGGISGKSFQAYPAPRSLHKQGTFRFNQAVNKLSGTDISIASTRFILKMSPTHSKSCRSSPLSQSLFLPPIFGTEPSPCLYPKPVGPHPPYVTTRRAGQEEYLSQSALHQGRRELPPSMPDSKLASLGRSGAWEQQSHSPRQPGDARLEKKPVPPSLELYRSCMEVTSTRSEGRGKGHLLQQLPVPPAEPSRAREARTLTDGKPQQGLGRKSVSTSREPGEKSSWGDSAIETDSSCSKHRGGLEADQRDPETHQRDLENGQSDLETDQDGLCPLELEYYTTQRIIEWVLQVNRILFSPSCLAEPQKYPLTEQDTSIKIVYEGD